MHYLDNIEATYKEIQVTAYNLKSAAYVDPLTYQQRVEVRYIDINTQVEKSLVDKQAWRYDAVAKRWWLVSGLPILD